MLEELKNNIRNGNFFLAEVQHVYGRFEIYVTELNLGKRITFFKLSDGRFSSIDFGSFNI